MDVMAEGLQFPEGPIAMPDGSVLLVEIARGTVSRVQPDGTVEVVADCGGGPNGIALGPDGRVYVCNNGGFDTRVDDKGRTRILDTNDSYVGGSIQAVDIDSGEVETLYTEVDRQGLSAPNDIVFDADGGFWFTDHGKQWERQRDHGGIYYGRPDGSHIAEVIYPVEAPNGIGLSPDDSRLYVAETHTGRVRVWDVTSPGQLDTPFGRGTRGRLLVGLEGEQLLDSLAVDADDHVCVATIRNGGVTDIAPDGGSTHVPTGDALTTNICFGGADLRTAYITASLGGTLLRTTWPRPGHRLHFNPYPD
ncbi:MAG: SMP-30/gluconolactonase/LRE family protein [Acidimicrobiales bacterium]